MALKPKRVVTRISAEETRVSDQVGGARPQISSSAIARVWPKNPAVTANQPSSVRASRILT